MSRRRKLAVASVVLLVGIALALPFRKRSGDSTTPAGVADTWTDPAAVTPSAPASLPARQAAVAATMASITHSESGTGDATPASGFDLAGHPALAGSLVSQQQSPVTPPVPPAYTPKPSYAPGNVQRFEVKEARPAYATGEYGRVAHHPDSADIRHVVQNSDTLEKLAKRYLGDEGRALEIFDLNRDVLDNPYLLPIDAELRIPTDVRRFVD